MTFNPLAVILIVCYFCLCIVPCTCKSSRKLQQPRIVGGNDVKRNEFPHFVQMGLCGGTLIAPGVVLSTAHCRDILEIGVFVTINPHTVKDLQAKRYKIVNRLFHPEYDYDSSSYDMILLQLEEPVYLNDDEPIQLVLNEDNDFPPDNTALTAIGFGKLAEGSNRFPKILQEVELESMNFEECNRTLEGDVVDDSFLCAGSEEANKDTCQGDSGGPLLYIDGSRHVLIGLVSWGLECGVANMPGVYARVSKGMDWIKKVVCECWNVEGASFCGDEVSTAAEEEWTFECPIQVDPNCQDTPGYVDYGGDVCASYEYWENPGCVDYGDSKGGPGFEDTNALGECCWCGGGSIVKPSSPVKFERDPECQDVEGWTDQHRDDCQWYEANTEEGTCSGWGGIPGGKGFRNVTSSLACCHCGGGSYPTPAPSPMPSFAPSSSRAMSPTQSTTNGAPTSSASATGITVASIMGVLCLLFHCWSTI